MNDKFRAFASLSLRAKLFIVFAGIVAAVTIVGGFTLYTVYSNLTTRVKSEQTVDVQSKVTSIEAFLTGAQSDAIFLSQSSALIHYLAVTEAEANPTTLADARAALESEFLAFAQARLFYDQVRFLDATGQEIARVNTSAKGVSTIVAQANLQNKANRYYFENSIGIAPGQVYISPLDLNIEGGEIEMPHKPVIRYGTPVHVDKQTRGVIVTNVLAENFLAPLGGGQVLAFMVDADGYYLYHPNESKRWGRDLETGITVMQDYSELTPALVSGESGTNISAGQVFAHTPITLPGEHTPRWHIANYVSRGKAFAPVVRAIYVGLSLIGITLLVVAAVTLFFSRTITAPLINLTRTAEKVALGDLSARARVEFGDEIGTLAIAFNIMAAQLQHTMTNLEQRVAERTQMLETSVEISRRLSTLLDQEQLVAEVVEQVQSAFGYYHVQITLVDEASGDLVMVGGTGEAGRKLLAGGHKIPRGKGLMSRAAATNAVVLVPDVSQDEGWLSHALLPDTKTEIAVPIARGKRVLGVLDVQQDAVDSLGQADADLLASIAHQVSIALQNAAFVQEVQSTAQRLRETDRIKDMFMSSMSHELRTPLNSIIGFAEVLLMGISGDLPPDAQEDVQSIFDNGQHLLSIINDILDLAKIESGTMTLHPEPIQVASLLEEIKTNNAGLLVEKPVKVLVQVQDDLPTLQADPVRMRQVLNNLVSNAAKFTDEGSITLRAYSDDGPHEDTGTAWVCLEVQDSGAGIPEDGLEKVFERFQQTDDVHSRSAKGTGLGLPITRQLVELHGGTIEVQSQLGKGSTFTVRLPMDS